MSRNSSVSPSEGEIVESNSEKANMSANAKNGTSVDRQSRNRLSISRSPSPCRSPGPYKPQDSSRDRSRSPYRESRAAKRQHEDDHYEHSRSDPRRFKVRFENSKISERGVGRYSQRELHHRGPSNRKHLRIDDWDSSKYPRAKHEHGRLHHSPRHLKTSMGYHDHDNHGVNHADAYARSEQNNRVMQGSPDKYKREQSVSNRSGTPLPIAQPRYEAESSDVQTLPGSTHNPAAHDNHLAKGNMSPSTMDTDVTTFPSQAQPNEAALIEERRKKREAIKAKHRGQATPVLVQALVLESKPNQAEDSSAQDTRATTPLLSTSENVSADSPSTPKASGEPDSPTHFVVAQDTDLASDKTMPDPTGGDDEPSAADYDPKMDMQEDKIRHDERQRHEATSAIAQALTMELNHNTRASEPVPDKPIKQRADDFDMFAEGDDMDVLAEPSSISHAIEKAVKRNVQTGEVQAIDMGMLDDWDDHEGYYKVMLGELLDGRYHVQSNLGKGMFSGVVRATDQKTRQLVAIKIVRNNETMYKAGRKEIGILQDLRNADLEDRKHLIRLERSFEHKGHLCMVFENLSINLREVLKKFGRDVGINLKAVRAYAQQMFLGLSLLRKCNILHADLKPDNVLVNETRNVLKICDLGSASDASDNEITQYLVSRFYRAPEVILGLPYDFAIDMWSVGCTLFELFTGKILFTGRSNNQMLRVIMECRGKFSHKMLRKAQFAGYHFDDLLNFKSVEKDRLTGKDTVRLLTIAKSTRDLKTRLSSSAKGMSDAEIKEINLFTDLLDRCLSLNPEKRCTPAEALKHPFITKQKA